MAKFGGGCRGGRGSGRQRRLPGVKQQRGKGGGGWKRRAAGKRRGRMRGVVEEGGEKTTSRPPGAVTRLGGFPQPLYGDEGRESASPLPHHRARDRERHDAVRRRGGAAGGALPRGTPPQVVGWRTGPPRHSSSDGTEAELETAAAVQRRRHNGTAAAAAVLVVVVAVAVVGAGSRGQWHGG